jgi:hypothetical protein
MRGNVDLYKEITISHQCLRKFVEVEEMPSSYIGEGEK